MFMLNLSIYAYTVELLTFLDPERTQQICSTWTEAALSKAERSLYKSYAKKEVFVW